MSTRPQPPHGHRIAARNRHKSMAATTGLAMSLWLGLTAITSTEVRAQWTQYGGPGQAFAASSKGLARTWPADGPPKLWHRDLGEGYSSVLADAGRLYTMYRAASMERVICLDAKTGKTLWEHAYQSGPQRGHYAKFGNGPESTPLLTDGKLYTIGVGGAMHCLEADTGGVLWTKDFASAFGVSMPD